jgi:DNA-binding beta-propeller fold protein YncE
VTFCRSAAALVVALLAAPALAAPTRSSPIQVSPAGVVFVVNPDSDSVGRLAFDAMQTGTLTHEQAVGDYPRTVALAGDQFVFTADERSDTVSRRDQGDLGNLQQANLGLGCAPYGVAVTPDGSRVVVSCQGTSDVVILQPDLQQIARVRLPWSKARAIAVSSDGARAYVTHFLTEEPNDDAHVSVVDLQNNAVQSVLAVPADITTCETQNSGQGVFNLVSTIALIPDGAPGEVANQVWVGGTQENSLSKGLFKRSPHFAEQPGAGMFGFSFAPFPQGGGTRNLYRASFHDITRFGIYKLDLGTGQVVGKIDIDEANNGTDIAFSADGTVAYVVDHMFNSYHVFDTARGQRPDDVTTLFAGPSRFGPGGAEDGSPCVSDALASVVSERPFRVAPQAQISVIRDYDPADLNGGVVATGLDFDAAAYMASGVSQMRAVPDGIGTAPMGVAVSPSGETVYVANYLSRNVVPVAAALPAGPAGHPANLRCSNAIAQTCGTSNDCDSGGGFCNHPGGAPCTTDADCGLNGPCVTTADCIPVILGPPVSSILPGSDPVPAAILDGKNLFNTAARDSSVPNQVGLDRAAPLFNDPAAKLPGSVTSTSHDASYVTCSTCHTDFGGQDGRTWDFSQFGASLRNTMDLRGRAGFAPGTCAGGPNAGQECTFDAFCSAGFFCQANPARIPPNIAAADRPRYFNPMLTVHWNGDRDEVEDFEHTYRQLMGAGDCDTVEDKIDTCMGALIQRSGLTSTDPVDVNPDLGPPNRNIRGPLSGKIVGIRLTNMADFVYSLSSFPQNPNVADEAAERGRKLFNDPLTQCANCHRGGPGSGREFFTDKAPNSSFDPAAPARADSNNPFIRHDVGTANLFDTTNPRQIAADNQTFQNPRLPIPGDRGTLGDYITPVLNDVWNTAPYLHDGSAASLLDVIRPCDAAVDDCAQPGRGRNVRVAGVEQHGATSFLTPRQLNDLAAFQKTLRLQTVVGDNARVLTVGTLAPSKMVLRFGKEGRTGRDGFLVKAALDGFVLDGGSALVLQVATPDGEQMAVFERTVTLEGRGRRLRGRLREGRGSIAVTLKRAGTGFRLLAVGKRLDLSALDSGNRDLTIAVESGGVTAAKNRSLEGKRRVFKLPRRRR